MNGCWITCSGSRTHAIDATSVTLCCAALSFALARKPAMTRPSKSTTDNVERADAYFEHGADIGVIGRGPTLEAAFEAVAAATFAIQTDLAKVRPLITVQVQFEESDVELALVRWINTLLSLARCAGVALGKFWLRRDGNFWIGGARGERWNAGHERGTEVKGATLTALSVCRVGSLWEARCVVDV